MKTHIKNKNDLNNEKKVNNENYENKVTLPILKIKEDKIKNGEQYKKFKKDENLSIKIVEDYDNAYWGKLINDVRSLKEHMRKVKKLCNNISYSQAQKISQILKSTKIVFNSPNKT